MADSMKHIAPSIGILRWEASKVSKGLKQLETLVGNSTNKKSFKYPVVFKHIEGANADTVIHHPSEDVYRRMVYASRELISEYNVQAIFTSCGFNGIFQNRLREDAGCPVFTSALLQIPFIEQSLDRDGKIIIVTADSKNLSEDHLKNCGACHIENYILVGLENYEEWNKIFVSDEEIDLKAVERIVIQSVKEAADTFDGQAGAVLLECTDLPPFSEKIRSEVHLPVYDFITMVNFVASALGVLTS